MQIYDFRHSVRQFNFQGRAIVFEVSVMNDSVECFIYELPRSSDAWIYYLLISLFLDKPDSFDLKLKFILLVA